MLKIEFKKLKLKQNILEISNEMFQFTWTDFLFVASQKKCSFEFSSSLGMGKNLLW